MKFELLDPEAIVESPSNPRKKRDPEADAELEASVRANGILEPVLVRRRRAANGKPTSVNAKKRYELIFGSRRLRAALAVGLTEIPAMLSDVPDDVALELQLVENAQRADVTPLEEADAMAMLVGKHGRDASAIADKLGRPIDFVRRRLILSRLIPELRELLEQERIGIGSSERLAALPTESQRELVGEDGRLNPARTNYQGQPEVWNQYQVIGAIEGISRPLAKAQWGLEEDGLGEKPPCVSCLTRTDAQAALFEVATELGRCLDGGCWAAKQAAYLARRRKEIEGSGAELVEGETVQQVLGQSWDPRRRYRRVDEVCDAIYEAQIEALEQELGGEEALEEYEAEHGAIEPPTWGELAGDAPRTFAVTESGEIVELVRIEDVAEALQQSDRAGAKALVKQVDEWTGKSRPPSKKTGTDPEKEARLADAKAKAAARAEKIGAIVDAVERWGFGAVAVEMLLAVEALPYGEDACFASRDERLALVSERRGWGDVDSLEALVADLDETVREGLFVELELAGWLGTDTNEYYAESRDAGFWKIAALAWAPPTCRVCGCTDDEACAGGCHWVEDDLCSACHSEGDSADAADDGEQLASDVAAASIYEDERFSSPEAAELHQAIAAGDEPPFELKTYTVKALREVLQAWQGTLYGESTKAGLVNAIEMCRQQHATASAAAGE